MKELLSTEQQTVNATVYGNQRRYHYFLYKLIRILEPLVQTRLYL